MNILCLHVFRWSPNSQFWDISGYSHIKPSLADAKRKTCKRKSFISPQSTFLIWIQTWNLYRASNSNVSMKTSNYEFWQVLLAEIASQNMSFGTVYKDFTSKENQRERERQLENVLSGSYLTTTDNSPVRCYFPHHWCPTLKQNSDCTVCLINPLNPSMSLFWAYHSTVFL